MNVDQLIGRLQADAAFMECVTEWRTLPASEGQYTHLPEDMDERLKEVLKSRGIHRLYSHQAQCWQYAQQKRDYVVVTPTLSLPFWKTRTPARCTCFPPRHCPPIR